MDSQITTQQFEEQSTSISTGAEKRQSTLLFRRNLPYEKKNKSLVKDMNITKHRYISNTYYPI